jgi:hypothetical protein
MGNRQCAPTTQCQRFPLTSWNCLKNPLIMYLTMSKVPFDIAGRVVWEGDSRDFSGATASFLVLDIDK